MLEKLADTRIRGRRSSKADEKKGHSPRQKGRAVIRLVWESDAAGQGRVRPAVRRGAKALCRRRSDRGRAGGSAPAAPAARRGVNQTAPP